MIHKSPPLKGLNTRIPIVIPIGEGGFFNHGSTLRRCSVWGLRRRFGLGSHGLAVEKEQPMVKATALTV